MKDWLNIISEKLCGGRLMLCVACQNRTGSPLMIAILMTVISTMRRIPAGSRDAIEFNYPKYRWKEI